MDSVYAIWHQLMFGFGTSRSVEISEHFPSSKELYLMLKDNQLPNNSLLPAERRAFKEYFDTAQQLLELTHKKGCKVITEDSEDYPLLLKESKGRPVALYVKGDLSVLKEKIAITVVGSRAYSEYGSEATEYFVSSLSESGAVVVSGCALGIDSIALQTAIKTGGKAVGILGCGIDVHYPKGNEKIKRAVAENGAIISEYPMGYQAYAFRFPVRNRIMAAISHGVLVVEAGVNSGALNTAKQALDYNREVFAVPGKVFMGTFKGCHKLINESMAKLVTDVGEIYEELPADMLTYAEENLVNEAKKTVKPKLSKEKSKKVQTIKLARKLSPDGLDKISAKVYATVDFEPMTADEISIKSDIGIAEVLGALTMLEIFGVVKSRPGGYFTLNID